MSWMPNFKVERINGRQVIKTKELSCIYLTCLNCFNGIDHKGWYVCTFFNCDNCPDLKVDT